MIFSLNFKMSDLKIEFYIMRVDENFFNDLDPIAD